MTLNSYMANLEAQGLIFAPQVRPACALGKAAHGLAGQGEAHCKECKLDYDAANVFQSYVQSFGFQRQRVGYLYGKYQDNGGVLVEAVYEPPQEGRPDGVTWNRKDAEIDKADAIAALLGMQRVTKHRGFLVSRGC